MSRKPDAAAELSAKMTQALQAQRAQTEGYPLTVRQLSRLADPQAPPELVLKALAKAPLSRQAVPANKKDLDAPIVHTDDAEQLAASPALLTYLLRAVCTESAPTATLGGLKKTLPATLKAAFEGAVKRQIAEDALPPEVEWL